jgi:hypothetical protein
MRCGRLCLLAILIVIVGACRVAASPNPVVDDWAIGDVVECPPEDQCPEAIAVARTGLEKRQPGHASEVSASLHNEGTYVGVNGEHVLATRSGMCCRVVRFELSDGTVAAIGVGVVGACRPPCGVGQAWDYGPARFLSGEPPRVP